MLALDAWPAIKRHVVHHSDWVDAPAIHGARPAIGFAAPLHAYRVTYRVDTGYPVGRVVRTETLEVARPWTSRLTTRQGAPPGRRVTDVQVGNLGVLDLRPVGQNESVLTLEPDLAPDDLRLDANAAALVKAGGVVEREQRTVLGRPCQVYRSSTPPQGQSLTKVVPDAADVVDTCVDRNGLILEQLQLSKGKLLLRRRAVAVDTQPSFAPDAFAITLAPTVPPSLGGGAIAQLDPATAGTAPGATYFLDTPPPGFTLAGYYAYSPPVIPSASGTPSANRAGGFVHVWTNGPDVVMLDQGGNIYGGDPRRELPLASEIDAGAFGTAFAAPGARFSEVMARLPDSRYVRIAGTIRLADLVALFKTLRRVDHP